MSDIVSLFSINGDTWLVNFVTNTHVIRTETAERQLATLIITPSQLSSTYPEKNTKKYCSKETTLDLGSAISGMIGGLPVITESVRSTANVANGAKTAGQISFTACSF